MFVVREDMYSFWDATTYADVMIAMLVTRTTTSNNLSSLLQHHALNPLFKHQFMSKNQILPQTLPLPCYAILPTSPVIPSPSQSKSSQRVPTLPLHVPIRYPHFTRFTPRHRIRRLLPPCLHVSTPLQKPGSPCPCWGHAYANDLLIHSAYTTSHAKPAIRASHPPHNTRESYRSVAMWR